MINANLLVTPMEWFYGFHMASDHFSSETPYVIMWITTEEEKKEGERNYDVVMCDAFSTAYKAHYNTDIIISESDDIFRICQILTEEGAIFRREEPTSIQWRVYKTPTDEMEAWFNTELFYALNYATYNIYISFPTEGTYLTEEQYNTCDYIAPYAIMEITGDLIEWRGLDDFEVYEALNWIEDNLYDYYSSLRVCETIYDFKGNFLGEQEY